MKGLVVMKFLRPLASVLVPLFCLALMAASAVLAVAPADPWKPLDPSHLAMKTPVVEKDADAEAIFWEVYMADVTNGDNIRTKLDNYVRIKIFTDRGKESQSKVDLLMPPGTEIKEIAARTIKADGTIVDLKKEDIFERTIAKAGGKKLKAKSFALPGVEPGAIVEYRWREIRNTTTYNEVPMQRDIPVQHLKYYVKPFSGPYFPFGMRVQTFNGQGGDFVKEKDGFYSTTLTNVPAFREEPRMPPEDEVRSWMLVYYTEDKSLDPQQFWKAYGKEIYEDHKASMKVNDDIRKKAAEIIGDASSPEQKLDKLFDFCRFNIKNISDDASGLTYEQIQKVKENKSPGDTLKRATGTWHDINMLFAALATAAGFEARVAALSNRENIFFNPKFPDTYFLRYKGTESIAVRVGNDWRFYDPSTSYMPYGMLRWQEEGQQALVSDPKEPVWVKTPLSPPQKSVEKRTAKLKLSEDGTLEGDIRIEFQGHLGADMKEYNDEESPAEREEILRNIVKERMDTAEVSAIRIENVTDPIKPFVYEFHVKIPGYAQRTGKRLFLQPAFFQHGEPALFTTSTRKHEIYFHYPWSEEDEVTIELPAGFVLDNADAPDSFTGQNISEYKVTIAADKDQRMLLYKRKFFFGADGSILFPAETYHLLRQYFDRVYKADNHTISLKQGTATAQTTPK
jgi:hypothetical protein